MNELKKYVSVKIEITELVKSDVITTSNWQFDEKDDTNTDSNGWT